MHLYHVTSKCNEKLILDKGLVVSSHKDKDTILINSILSNLPFNRNKCLFLSPYSLSSTPNTTVFKIDSSKIPSKAYVGDRSILDALVNAHKVGLSVEEYAERYVESLVQFKEYLENRSYYDEDYDVEVMVLKNIPPSCLEKV